MINSFGIQNFKGIRQTDITFERFTVIVGPNASGKTSLLEGLHYLSQMGAVDPKEFFQGQKDPLELYRRGADGQAMELSCMTSEGGLRLRLFPSTGTPEPWDIYFDDNKIYSHSSRVINNDAIRKVLAENARKLQPADLLRLDAARMVDPLASSSTRMAYDGTGLSSALAFMALNQPDDFQEIQHRLEAVIPSVKRIRFDQVQANPINASSSKSAFRILFDFKGASGIPAHLASEGTILVLGLLTALMGRGRPDLILLDDLDRGLHPKAQREVVRLLRIILEQNPDLQIVATSHSPYLVDHLRPEEVRLTTLGDDGTVSCASLVDHPDFEKWKDEMAPGEMWSLFGEKWVSEVNKVAGGE